jgi:hypothetical protein
MRWLEVGLAIGLHYRLRIPGSAGVEEHAQSLFWIYRQAAVTACTVYFFNRP